MAETLIVIQQGNPLVAEAAVQFVGTGSAGDPDACRRLIYPSSVSPFLAPITYTIGGVCLNPTRTLNLDNVVLTHPITDAVRTLGTTRVLRFETEIDDIIVTEIWTGSDRVSSMPTAFFRLLYEYLINPPPITLVNPVYIQWEPRDRNENTYDIEILSLSVGGNSDEERFDVLDLRDAGGIYRGGSIANALDDLSPEATGLIDREVRLRFKIVGIAS